MELKHENRLVRKSVDTGMKVIFNDSDKSRRLTARLGNKQVLVMGLSEGGQLQGATVEATQSGASWLLAEVRVGFGLSAKTEYLLRDVDASRGLKRILPLGGLSPKNRLDADTVGFNTLAEAKNTLELHFAIHEPAPGVMRRK